jgi:hypothetical protein
MAAADDWVAVRRKRSAISLPPVPPSQQKPRAIVPQKFFLERACVWDLQERKPAPACSSRMSFERLFIWMTVIGVITLALAFAWMLAGRLG